MKLLNHLIVVFGWVLYFASAYLVIDENTPKRLFDEDLYRNVLDQDECRRQLDYMKNAQDSTLLGQFFDAGVRLPRGFFMITVTDLGNYHQCLDIDERVEDMRIEGKFYFLRIPFNQTLRLPFDESIIANLTNPNPIAYDDYFRNNQDNLGPVNPDQLNPENPLVIRHLEVSMCVPKPCTSEDWITSMLFNVTNFGFQYEEVFVRLPNDKPWVGADYAAVTIFSIIGFITLLSTLYDMNHILIQRRDPKKANIFLRSFSVYTNTQRLVTFTPNPNALDSLDGLRSISMMWIILGHTFSMYTYNGNLTVLLTWLTSGNSVWAATAPYSVDTFFLMGGALLTYTTIGKSTGVQLVKRLHLFYLNRLLRMFPLLAAMVLLEASVFHRVADGPNWKHVADNVQNCRTFWWSTLLHVQNFVNPDNICIRHSWYIAIDIQLYVISPIVLFWVLGKNKKAAWAALCGALLACLVAGTVWNFFKDLPSTAATIVRLEEQSTFLREYYYLPWTRGAPFFVGMILGYILGLYKGKKVHLSMGFVLVSWVISLGLIASLFYTSYAIIQTDWDNQLGDNLINSFMRVVWSIGVSWIIFACSKGYGGPMNWLLTLDIWKLSARISFAMYLSHYSITFIISGMEIVPVHFTVGARIFDFLGVFTLTYILSFFLTVVIDAPFSVLIKILMEGGQRRNRPPPRNAVNSSKPGSVLEKNMTNLERSISTLEKNASNEKNNVDIEKNGSHQEQNGPTIKLEESGESMTVKNNL